MQHTGETFCSFCKKSASQLVTHSLCHCCLEQLECGDPSAEKPISIVSKENVVRKVECNICLEEYQEDELQQHRMMCMPQRVFRCSVCDGDYLSKEGLLNHLTLHEVANEKKELHCQEKRASYKFYNCIICNDQRCYQQIIYWRHVHEDHDGFFLRCSGCSESFRSQKDKTDHILNHCKHSGKKLPSGSAEFDVDYAYGITTVNKQHSAQALEKDVESANHAEKQGSSGTNMVQSLSEDIHGQNDYASVTDYDDALASEEAVINDSDESSGVKCPHCDKQYSSVKYLAHHISSKHRPNTCDICGLFFTSGNKARYHKRVSHSNLNFKCSECSKEFVVKLAYERHLLTHQVERKFVCKECGSAFKGPVALKTHTKIAHIRYENLQIDSNSRHTKPQERKYNKAKKAVKIDCPICRESFNGHDMVSQHVQEKHELSICTSCKVTFSSAHELTEHKCTICSDCGKECYQQMRLASHIKLCHELMKCDVCGIFIPGESQLTLHKLKLHGEPRYKCSHCSKKFRLKRLYQQHIEKYSEIKTFPCEYCDRKFKRLNYVISHMRRIHCVKITRKDIANYNRLRRNDAASERQDENVFELESIVEVGETTLVKPEYPPECSSSSENVAEDMNNEVAEVNTSSSSRKRNKRKQKVSRAIGEIASTEPSDTVCPHCGKECYHKSRLINHISWGHDLIECDICELSLVGKSQLWYHKLTAHSEPKFKCRQCPMKFHLNNSLRRHVSMHDKYSKMYPCKSCTKKFKTLVLLNKHMKHVHLIKKGPIGCIEKPEEELEVKKVKKIAIKKEVSDEKSSLQHKSLALDGDDGAKGNPLKCPHCDKKCHHESALARHIKSTHVPTSCEVCGTAFNNKHQLGYHKLTNHVDPKYECPHCSEKFHIKLSFERHVERHGTNKFPCKFCSLMFKNALSTSLHVRQAHLGRKAFAKKVKKN